MGFSHESIKSAYQFNLPKLPSIHSEATLSASSPTLFLQSEEYKIESDLISDNLLQFARDLRLRFDIEFVSFQTFDYLSFKSIQLIDGEKTAVLLSTVFNRITSSSCSGSDSGFINNLRRISPHVIVCVDGQGLARSEPSSFRQKLIDGVEFYKTVLESLEAANVGGGGT